MMWRSVGFVLTLSTLGLPQDPPQPDGEALYKELLEKLDASGPFTAKLAFESVDEKGVASVRFKMSFHIRMKEGWVYTESHVPGKEEQTACSVFDGNRYIQVWAKGGVGGTRTDVRSAFQALLKHQWRMDAERRNVLEDPDPPKDFAAYAAGLRFYLFFQLEPSAPGAPEPAAFRLALGATDKGGISWLKAVRGPGKSVATVDEVTVREAFPTRTTVIDRRTGFLRSIRLDLPSGVSKVIKTVEVSSKAKHPDVTFPEKWIDRPWRTAETLKMLGPIMRSDASSDVIEILKQWSRTGQENRAEALRSYIAWIGAERDAQIREATRTEWAAQFVQGVVKQGTSLDQMSRDFDALSKKFGDQVRTLESDSKQAGVFAEVLINFRQELENAVADTPGFDDARKILIRRIQEGFEPDRIKKAIPSLGTPDFARNLREAIDAARDQGAK